MGGGDGVSHLRAIAAGPRPAGGESERRARAYCAGVLRGHGFSVTEEPFSFSAWPGRWATPSVGIIALGTLAGAAMLGRAGRGGVALGLLLVSLLVVAVGASVVARTGVTDLPFMRRQSVNLVATRGVPRLWLVAHLDSKSQPVPIALRAVGIMVTSVVWIAGMVAAMAQVGGVDVDRWWTVLGVLGALAALPIVATTVGSRSAGAVDNASGVATVLDAVGRLPADQPVGVLIPSAEELGLAGARQWARIYPPGTAINVDGVDDVGALAAMYSGAKPARLIERVARAASMERVSIRAHRLLPGVLTDGVALSNAGWEVVTLSKATWRTLSRVHRPSDSLASIAGTGIDEAARVLAAAVRAIEG